MPVRGYLKRKSVQTKLWSIQLNLPGGSVGVVVVVDGVVGAIVIVVIIAVVIVVAVEDMQTVYNIERISNNIHKTT